MKKNYFLLITLGLLIFSNHSKAQTVVFNSNAGTLWDDGIAKDGEAGSTDISGLSLEIYNVNDALNNISELDWKSAGDLSMSPDNFNGLTTFDAPYGAGAFLGWKGHIIKETFGLEFQVNAFDWFDWRNYDNQNMTVTGYKDGSQVAMTSFVGNNNGNRVTVNLNADFDAIDELRILTTSGTTYPTLNNIQIAGAVLRTESKLLPELKLVVKNNKFVSNIKDIKIEVYSLLGQKLENENLKSGIYIIKVTLNNSKSLVYKRYL